GQEEPQERIRGQRAEELTVAVALPVRRAGAEVEGKYLPRVKHVPLVVEREAAPRVHVSAPENRDPLREEVVHAVPEQVRRVSHPDDVQGEYVSFAAIAFGVRGQLAHVIPKSGREQAGGRLGE